MLQETRNRNLKSVGLPLEDVERGDGVMLNEYEHGSPRQDIYTTDMALASFARHLHLNAWLTLEILQNEK